MSHLFIRDLNVPPGSCKAVLWSCFKPKRYSVAKSKTDGSIFCKPLFHVLDKPEAAGEEGF